MNEAYVRVRYAETDQFGVVYFGNYFTYFEVSRGEFFRKVVGMSYREVEEKGLFFVVVEACCRYLKPARYDEVLRIETRLVKIGSKSMEFVHRVYRDDVLIAEGREVLVSVDRNGKATPLPEWLLKRVKPGG